MPNGLAECVRPDSCSPISGYTNHGCRCPDCKSAMNTSKRKEYSRRKTNGICVYHADKKAENGTVRCVECNKRQMVRNARRRARQDGVDFNIVKDDLPEIPKVCPICHTIMSRGEQTANSPSLDRLIPEIGYVEDNLVVICTACNQKKNNFSLREMRAMVKWLTTEIGKRGLPEYTI